MEEEKRIELSNLIKVKDEDEIQGNYTSVIGEYKGIPETKKTGFYKENGCMIGANNDEDLRELLASKILDKIKFPHADIVLAKDNDNNGCISINILNEDECFLEPNLEKVQNKPINNIKDFINNDLEKIWSIPNMTAKSLNERQEYILQYLFVSAIISNTDIKMDNMFMIQNKQTEEFRNPEYYDMGIAFIENEERKFFGKFSSKQIIEQLYEQYYIYIEPLGKAIQENLQEEDIEKIMGEKIFNEFSPEIKEEIKNQLLEKVNLINKLNQKEKNKFIYSTEVIHKATENIDIGIKDRVKEDLLEKETKEKEKGNLKEEIK